MGRPINFLLQKIARGSIKIQVWISEEKRKRREMENKKDIFASSCFTVLCQMERRRRETGSVIPQVQAKHFASNPSYFHQKIVFFCRSGFCNWKNAAQRMVGHESSRAYRDATMTMCRKAKASGHSNSLFIEQYQAKHVYATTMLQRVVATIKFLGLAFQVKTMRLGFD